MSFFEKIEKAYNCLKEYKDHCDSEAQKVFIDIFSPMFFQENHHSLKISVGKQMRSCFQSWLTSAVDDFNVVLSKYNTEPIIVIRDSNGQNSLSINLTLMTNLCVHKSEDEMAGVHYFIEFTYNNEIDYQMSIVINKD